MPRSPYVSTAVYPLTFVEVRTPVLLEAQFGRVYVLFLFVLYFSLNSLWQMLMLHLVALRILEQVSKAMPTRARFRPPARVARSPPEGGAERRWRSLPTQRPLEAKICDIYVKVCREKPAFKSEFCRIALTVFIGEPKHVVINYYRSIISKLFAPK